MFDIICLTLKFADTHEIAKYARMNVRIYTHTHSKQKLEKVGDDDDDCFYDYKK